MYVTKRKPFKKTHVIIISSKVLNIYFIRFTRQKQNIFTPFLWYTNNKAILFAYIQLYLSKYLLFRNYLTMRFIIVDFGIEMVLDSGRYWFSVVTYFRLHRKSVLHLNNS